MIHVDKYHAQVIVDALSMWRDNHIDIMIDADQAAHEALQLHNYSTLKNIAEELINWQADSQTASSLLNKALMWLESFNSCPSSHQVAVTPETFLRAGSLLNGAVEVYIDMLFDTVTDAMPMINEDQETVTLNIEQWKEIKKSVNNNVKLIASATDILHWTTK